MDRPQYVAGIIDGEGHIGLQKHKDKRLPLGWRYKPLVNFTSTNKLLIEYFQEKVEKACVWEEKKRERHKVSFKWELLSRTKIKKLLDEILPFLIVKKKQAELLLEFIEIQEQQFKLYRQAQKNNFGSFVKGVAIIYTERQHQIYEELKQLNRRGI